MGTGYWAQIEALADYLLRANGECWSDHLGAGPTVTGQSPTVWKQGQGGRWAGSAVFTAESTGARAHRCGEAVGELQVSAVTVGTEE